MKDKRRLDEGYKKGKYYWAIHDVRLLIFYSACVSTPTPPPSKTKQTRASMTLSIDTHTTSRTIHSTRACLPSFLSIILIQLTSVVATAEKVKVVGITADEHATLIFSNATDASQWSAEINAEMVAHRDDAASAAALAVAAGIADPSAGIGDDEDGDAAVPSTPVDASSAASAPAPAPAATTPVGGNSDDAQQPSSVSSASPAVVDTNPAPPATEATQFVKMISTTSAATPVPSVPSPVAAPAAVSPVTKTNTLVTTAAPVVLPTTATKTKTEAEPPMSMASAAAKDILDGTSSGDVVAPVLPGHDASIEPGSVEYDEVTKRHRAYYYSHGTKVELGSFFTEAAATAVHDAVTYLKVNPYADDFSAESLIDTTTPIDPAEGAVVFDDAQKKWRTTAVVDGSLVELGTFFTKEAAVVAFNERDTLCAQQ